MVRYIPPGMRSGAYDCYRHNMERSGSTNNGWKKDEQYAQRNAIRCGNTDAQTTFNYFNRDAGGRISQESFRQFWGDGLTDDAAKAIYAHYDKDNNGLDMQEFAKYQKEYSASLKRGGEAWEEQYEAAVKSGVVDYSKFYKPISGANPAPDRNQGKSGENPAPNLNQGKLDTRF